MYLDGSPAEVVTKFTLLSTQKSTIDESFKNSNGKFIPKDYL